LSPGLVSGGDVGVLQQLPGEQPSTQQDLHERVEPREDLLCKQQ